MLIAVFLLFFFVTSYGQIETDNPDKSTLPIENEYIAKIANFSIECLYNTAKNLVPGQNMIMSPVTIFTTLAVMSEAAYSKTRREINHSLRILSKNRDLTRKRLAEIKKWLKYRTSTVDLVEVNSIFVDKERLPLIEFTQEARTNYETEIISLSFENPEARLVNQVISNATHGRILSIVDSNLFENSAMFLSSAVFFKGKWAIPFNSTATSKQPFYDANHFQIGEVNMMFNRARYPFSNIKDLQARLIELPYGKENRMSMLVMLPDPDVSLEDMMANLKKVSLKSVFNLLRLAKEQYSDDEVDCFIPRFNIKSDLDLTYIMKRLGIYDMFDKKTALLPYIARTPLYVSKLVHKSEIEVTEEGVSDTAPAPPSDGYDNRFGVSKFEANRPFAFIIVEKITETIVLGGFYRQPTL